MAYDSTLGKCTEGTHLYRQKVDQSCWEQRAWVTSQSCLHAKVFLAIATSASASYCFTDNIFVIKVFLVWSHICFCWHLPLALFMISSANGISLTQCPLLLNRTHPALVSYSSHPSHYLHSLHGVLKTLLGIDNYCYCHWSKRFQFRKGGVN